MRVKVTFSSNTTPVAINSQDKLNGYIHKCIGSNNEYHDNISDYCISHLCGGKMNDDKKTLSFKNGSFFMVSSTNIEFLNSLLSGITENTNLFNGMIYTGIEIVNEKLYDGWSYLRTLSPILINDSEDINRYLTIKDNNFENKFKLYLLNYLKKVGENKGLKFDLEGFDVKVPKYRGNKVKNIRIHNRYCFANQCQINIKTNKKVMNFLYANGIGQSTGSGFGTVYLSSNRELYS